MAGRRPLFPGQKTVELTIVVSEDIRNRLREVAATVGLEPSTYVRSLIFTHLNRMKT